MNELEYPGHPIANWRISISRRFNIPEIDQLYFNSVLPILENEGILLECSSAPEETESVDYWMNRYCAILELTDIHIVLDMDRSANMEFEYWQLKKVRRGFYAALQQNFGISPPVRLRLFGLNRPIPFTKPVVIHIRKKTLIDTFLGYKRKGTIGFKDSYKYHEFRVRLKKQIHKAKLRRLKDLHRIQNFFEPKLKRFNLSEDDLIISLRKMTEYARCIAQGISLKTFYNKNKYQLNSYPLFQIDKINKRRQWYVKLYKGEVDKDLGFSEICQILTEDAKNTFIQLFMIINIEAKGIKIEKAQINIEEWKKAVEESKKELEEIPPMNYALNIFSKLNGLYLAIGIWRIHRRLAPKFESKKNTCSSI